MRNIKQASELVKCLQDYITLAQSEKRLKSQEVKNQISQDIESIVENLKENIKELL